MSKRVLNVILAALAAGVGAAAAVVVDAGNPFTQTIAIAAAYAGLRAIIGALALYFDRPIPTDVD